MIDRDLLIEQKKLECERKIELLHRQFPRLEEISFEIGALSVRRIRVGLLKKNQQESEAIDKRVKELLAEKEQILRQNGLTEEIYEPEWNCTKCKDKGYTHPGVLCECYIQEKVDRVFKASGIQGEMEEYSFANFDINYYKEPAYMGERIHRSIAFVEKLQRKEPQQNLIFLGAVGLGKTHLSVAIANAALANNNTVVYKRSEDLVDLIRQQKFDKDANHSGVDGLNYLREVDLLVIDDFGAEYNTAFATTQLQLLIEDRNLLNKPWIINTNLSPQKIQEVYGGRLADRLLEKAMIFQFEAEGSIRLRKKRS